MSLALIHSLVEAEHVLDRSTPYGVTMRLGNLIFIHHDIGKPFHLGCRRTILEKPTPEKTVRVFPKFVFLEALDEDFIWNDFLPTRQKTFC